MPAYTTAQLDTIVATLEVGLGQGFATLRRADGSEVMYRNVADIRNALAYFKALYNEASDAPIDPTPKVRTFLFYGGKGFGF